MRFLLSFNLCGLSFVASSRWPLALYARESFRKMLECGYVEVLLDDIFLLARPDTRFEEVIYDRDF